MGFAEQVRELARDLVTLEINTIIKSNMTGERMPTVPNALLDISRDYVKAFAALRADVSGVFAHEPSAQASWRDVPIELVPLDAKDVRFFELPDRISFGTIFERLRWAAKNTRHAYISRGLPVTEENLFLLDRIENNADTLRCLLDRYPGLRSTEVTGAEIRAEQAKFFPPYELTARDVLVITKIWEIGIEQIVAQTSIQLDGDVVTRIARHLAADRERAAQILAVHQQGVETGVGHWRAIMDAAVAVVGGIAGSVGTSRARRR